MTTTKKHITTISMSNECYQYYLAHKGEISLTAELERVIRNRMREDMIATKRGK